MSEIIDDIEREDRITDLILLDSGKAVEMIFDRQGIVVEGKIGLSQQIARPLAILVIAECFPLRERGT